MSFKIVKAYDYDSKTVADIAKDTTKLVLIAMVRDNSIDNKFITLQKTHNFSYDVYSLAFTNVKIGEPILIQTMENPWK